MKGPEKLTVRLVRRLEHPYVIEVTTPGWRGFDLQTRKILLPESLQLIRNALHEAGVHGEPGWLQPLFNADGTTEIALKTSLDFKLAVEALVRGGWLSPEMSSGAAIWKHD